MKHLVLVFGAVLILFGVAKAQRPSTPVPQSTPNPLYETPEADSAVRRSEDLNRRSESLRLTEKFPVKDPAKRKKFREVIRPLYRDSTKKERAFLAPMDEDRESNAAILSQKRTGIFRLIMNRGCAGGAKTVAASKACTGLTMPGAGSAYSFRIRDYRMHHISDINFNKHRLEALGVLTHGVVVDLGYVQLEDISLSTPGVVYLARVKPAKNFADAGAFADKLVKGFRKDGFVYGSMIPVRNSSTYVLRSIAYRGEAQRNVGGVVYNELLLDKRRDIIVAFKIVRLKEGTDATIVWKVLSDKKAPRLKPNKK